MRRTFLTSRAVAGVVAAGLVAGSFLVFALVSDGNGEVAALELAQQYDPQFVDSWVRGCVSSGETPAFCRCAIDEYTSRLRPDEFETAAAVAQSGGQVSELPENLRDAVQAVERDCR